MLLCAQYVVDTLLYKALTKYFTGAEGPTIITGVSSGFIVQKHKSIPGVG